MTTATAAPKYLDRIIALLAKAEDPAATPEEAKAYAAKAQELATKWQIDEAQLASHRPASSVGEEPGQTAIWFDFGPYMLMRIQLLNVVAEANGCKLVYTPGLYKRDRYFQKVANKKGGYAKGAKARIYGFESGRQVTQLVYASLLIQLENEFAKPYIQRQLAYEAPKAGNRIKWKNGFVQGFAQGVQLRFIQAAKRVTDDVPGSALALRDRGEQVAQYMAEDCGKVRQQKSSAGGYSGRTEGFVAGKRADIGQTGLTGKKAIG